MEQSVAVIGAGSWGTALAIVLADNGFRVNLWARRQELVDEVLTKRTNSRYLPDIKLPETIMPTTKLAEAVNGQDHIFIVMPSAGFRDTMKELAPYVSEKTRLIHATKGFDMVTLSRMTQVMLEEIPSLNRTQLAVLSGPSHAEEVSLKCPTTIVVASPNQATAEQFQDLLMNSYFRVYTNPDVIGTELGGALKNIIALGVGLSDGLEFGDNAKAALMTRGLMEISRLGIAMGAAQMTFAGLAGVGDLIATCTSRHSRNWRAGYQLGQGKSLQEVLGSMGMVVEGVNATRAAYMLAAKYNVTMPITSAIYQVLFEGKTPREAVEDLMGRGKTHEMEEAARFSINWES